MKQQPTLCDYCYRPILAGEVYSATDTNNLCRDCSIDSTYPLRVMVDHTTGSNLPKQGS